MRYLGIDYGEKKTGLAIGDDESNIASPLEVVAGGVETYAVVRQLIGQEGIDAIVVGLPLSAGAHSSDQLDKTKLFIERLEERLDVPVYDIDERYTSAESRRIQAETGTDAAEDALAAMLILQAFLDEKAKSKS